MKRTKIRFENSKIKTIIVLALIVALGISAMVGTYQALLSNARTMGMELVRSYCADEERNIAVYRTYIRMGLYYLEELENSSCSKQEFTHKMENFLKRTATVVGDSDLQSCVMKNGEEIASNINDKSSLKNYQNTDWYYKARKAAGDVVFCNVAEEKSERGELTVVAAVEPFSGNAIVIFLERENYQNTHMDLKLMDQGAYYLFDENGRLLFYDAPFMVDEDATEEYAANMCQKIKEGSLEKTGGGIVDITGKKRDIYHCTVSNGWLCVMTVPRYTLLAGFYKILWYCGGVLAILLLVMLDLYLRDLRRGNSVHYVRLMMQALSNTYYALYRINLKDETYVRIKNSNERERTLAEQGKYDEMLEDFLAVLDDRTARDLKNAFSLENVRKVVSENIRNYGGDFLHKINGRECWVNISVIQDDILGKNEIILAFRKIDTEKKRQLQHTRLLEDALNAAEASEMSQQKFFANMSHEMRTPLNIILGMNELAMRENCTPEKRLVYQKKLEQEARRMLEMVNDILEMSRPEYALVPLQRKSINLTETLKDILKPYGKTAEEEGKQFTVKADVECPVVMGDALKLEKILGAVVSNALRYTNKGDSITVSLHQAGIDNKNYIFVIEDTGIGMSSEFLPRLFEPYSMEKRFGDRSAAGNGLGMSIVKNLVTQKGGQIKAESEEGKGTKIIITLPFAPDAEGTFSVDTHPDIQQKDVKEEKEKTINILEGLRIMVVDDNEMNREFVGELLEEQGAIVDLAPGGRESVEMFCQSEKFAYDIILMDIMMPEVDGCEAARLIRSQQRADAETVIILALTANSFAEDVIRTMESGINAHLVKPINMKILQETVQKLLKKKNEN